MLGRGGAGPGIGWIRHEKRHNRSYRTGERNPSFRLPVDSRNLDGVVVRVRKENDVLDEDRPPLKRVHPFLTMRVLSNCLRGGALPRSFIHMAAPSSQLRTVLEQLPFGVDDIEAANEVFQDWRESGAEADLQIVDLWTYCYICRYFLGKAAADEFSNASDADELITKAYQKVQNKRDTVRNPNRYAHWVSVVCKNTFLNYTRRDRVSESIDEEEGPTLSEDGAHPLTEYGFVREAFEAAIERLPDYLQEPARLYFLENREFEEISDTVDKPVATIRTYKHKAVKRLRQDDTLREYVDVSDL